MGSDHERGEVKRKYRSKELEAEEGGVGDKVRSGVGIQSKH